jgi:hypothetical protein
MLDWQSNYFQDIKKFSGNHLIGFINEVLIQIFNAMPSRLEKNSPFFYGLVDNKLRSK